MLSRRGLILLSVTILLSCAGNSLDAVTGGDSGAEGAGTGGAGGSGAGGAGTGGAGTGGAGTGGAATGGAGIGGAGTGGATMDGGGTGGAATDGPADISGETAGETGVGDICAAFIPGTTPSITSLPGISASDFCNKYATLCVFGAAMSYSSMDNCMTSYGGAGTTNQSCRAAYLCRKKAVPANPFDCPAATGASICM